MNEDQLIQAKAIILRSLKSPSGKLLVEYPGWTKLPYEVRVQAMQELTCEVCHKVRPITGTYSHIFGTDRCCFECSDQHNYPHLYRDGKRIPWMEM